MDDSDQIPPDELLAVLKNGGMADDDSKYVLRSLWSQGEIPEIKSLEQYVAYAEWKKDVEAKLTAAGVSLTDPEYFRSQEGILATSIGARMIEWEESRTAGH